MPTDSHSISSEVVIRKMQDQETFVINVVATWCSDCTQQQKHLVSLHDAMREQNIEVFQLLAQHEKGVFVDIDHAELVQQFGGHGYPRTVLIKNGYIVSSDNVEMISEMQLSALALKFNTFL